MSSCAELSEVAYPAKKLILNLVKEAHQPIPAAVMLRMAGLFGVEANNVRVTLNRLVRQELLELSGRGIYVLGPRARRLADQQSAWRHLEDELKPWKGGWLAIYTSHLGRRDRKRLRSRERAVSLLGFQELYQGLLVRPDNLQLDLVGLTEKLHSLGLEEEACVFRAHDFSGSCDPASQNLWPVTALNKTYAKHTESMLRWTETHQKKSLEVAARESFLLGDQVLRDIAFDPRLPAAMVDVDARRRMVETMADYDDLGKAIWRELLNRFMGEASAAEGK